MPTLLPRVVRRAGQPERAVRYRWVEWSDMTPELAVAVIAAEDQRFPQHHGLDFEAIGEEAADEGADDTGSGPDCYRLRLRPS